jgi:hypothetical protein
LHKNRGVPLQGWIDSTSGGPRDNRATCPADHNFTGTPTTASRWLTFNQHSAIPSKRRFIVPHPADTKDHVYKILELVGSSDKSIEDAIQNAITRAAKTVRSMKWFEVVQTRGHVEDGSVRHYQVALRVGFTLEG